MANVQDVKESTTRKTIFLGGKERTLRFDLNAMAELENRCGSIKDAMDALQTGGLKGIRTLLWAACLHEEVKEFDEITGEPLSYNITPYTVSSWVTPKNLNEVTAALTDCLGVSMGDMAKAEAALPAPEEAAKNA